MHVSFVGETINVESEEHRYVEVAWGAAELVFNPCSDDEISVVDAVELMIARARFHSGVALWSSQTSSSPMDRRRVPWIFAGAAAVERSVGHTHSL